MIFDIRDGRKTATAIECRVNGAEQGIVLTENDLVFVTNGSCTEGDHLRRPGPRPNGDAECAPAAAGICGRTLPSRNPAFGRPGEVLLRHLQDQLGVGHHHYLDDKILPYISNIC